MRYDPDNQEFIFSTEMELSEEGRRAVWDNHGDHVSNVLSDPLGAINRYSEFSKDNRDQETDMFTKIASGILIASGIAFIICLVLKQLMMAGYIAAGSMILIGILMAFKPKTASNVSFVVPPLIQVIQGICLIGGGGFLIYLLINIKYYTSAEIMLWIFGIVFGLCAIFLLLQSAGQFLSPSMVYSEEVDATCIGYLRKIESSGGESHHLYIMTSPLFEYSYEGVKYQSAYDNFISKENGTIPVGSKQTIRISPDHPSHVLGHNKGLGATFLLFGLICLAATGFLFFFLFSGHVNDSQIELSGPAAPTYSRYISDDKITEYYGDDWYIEKTTLQSVEERHEEDLDYVIVKVDDTFEEVYFNADGFELETGDEAYVIYEVTTEDGATVKHVLNINTAEDTGYNGSHAAYRP